MTRLEAFYLVVIIPFLSNPTLFAFVQVCRACLEACRTARTNPWRGSTAPLADLRKMLALFPRLETLRLPLAVFMDRTNDVIDAHVPRVDVSIGPSTFSPSVARFLTRLPPSAPDVALSNIVCRHVVSLPSILSINTPRTKVVWVKQPADSVLIRSDDLLQFRALGDAGWTVVFMVKRFYPPSCASVLRLLPPNVHLALKVAPRHCAPSYALVPRTADPTDPRFMSALCTAHALETLRCTFDAPELDLSDAPTLRSIELTTTSPAHILLPPTVRSLSLGSLEKLQLPNLDDVTALETITNNTPLVLPRRFLLKETYAKKFLQEHTPHVIAVACVLLHAVALLGLCLGTALLASPPLWCSLAVMLSGTLTFLAVLYVGPDRTPPRLLVCVLEVAQLVSFVLLECAVAVGSTPLVTQVVGMCIFGFMSTELWGMYIIDTGYLEEKTRCTVSVVGSWLRPVLFANDSNEMPMGLVVALGLWNVHTPLVVGVVWFFTAGTGRLLLGLCGCCVLVSRVLFVCWAFPEGAAKVKLFVRGVWARVARFVTFSKPRKEKE